MLKARPEFVQDKIVKYYSFYTMANISITLTVSILDSYVSTESSLGAN